jgi:hypothetical protein
VSETRLPEGCGYQGYEFGAAYPDSLCCGGKLYDADNCDGHGRLYEPTDDIPCPICHPLRAIRYWTERNRLGGQTKDRAYAAAKSLVQDIRNNRKNGTGPWRQAQ